MLLRTPMFDRHVALGAKLGDFGGWEMPIQYAGSGVIEEHRAVRERVGLFDVGHLGKVTVTGPGAASFVDSGLTNALGRIAPGQAQYSMCCDDATGGVVDDLIAYLHGPDDVLLVPNAANSATVASLLAAAAPAGVQVTDRHREFGVLAVQGPRSADAMSALGLPVDLAYMSFTTASWQDAPLVVCRTGYTGERGYELLPAWEAAPSLWDALLAAVSDLGGLPVGLGARDTLRTEMGYALHGHELTPSITPVQARLGWAVGWDKPAFWGRSVLLAERAARSGPLATGLVALDRGVPREGMDVVAGDRVVGRTTSGTFSPTLQQGVALALLDRSVAEGDEVSVLVRGRALRCRVQRPPFVTTDVRT